MRPAFQLRQITNFPSLKTENVLFFLYTLQYLQKLPPQYGTMLLFNKKGFRMKTILFSMAVLLSSQFAFAEALTDEMAIEAGMSPVSEIGMNPSDLNKIMNFERSNYIESIPSQEDIAKVIQSHRQVIVINKSASGPDAQTLRLYLNGSLKPLTEKNVVKKVINGKTLREETLEEKNYVRISTGREKNEKATSGRTYFSTTPKGFFRPQRLYEMYYSNTWKADMPNAIFINCSRHDFTKECGIAIHATSESHYAELGKRDSGGCIRTKLEVSKQIRDFVMESGSGVTNFSIKNEGYRRNKIIGNSIVTDLINRDSGDILNKKINSWDTVIVVYE